MSIPFDKLWKAVRGGGGGAYGLVTSAYYQLHPYKPLYRVFPDVAAAPAFLGTCAISPGCIEAVSPLLALFFINLLYDPEAIGLDTETSNSCGSPTLAIDISWALRGVDGQLFCRNPEPVLAAWQAYISNFTELEAFGEGLLPLGQGIFSVTNVGSYAQVGLSHDGSRAPLGRIPDEHPPATNYITENCWAILVPVDFLLLKSPEALSLFSAIIPAHVIGGNSAISGDSMTAVPHAERAAGVQGYLCPDLVGVEAEQAAWTTWQFFHPPDLAEGEFYGGSEYNHIDNIWFGPMKSDFTTPCPGTLSVEEKEERCVGVLETVWGTKLLAELEDIKLEVDPKNMFRCYRCVGEKNPHICKEATKCRRRKVRHRH